MTTTYVGLGSNLQQPTLQLDNAITALQQLPDCTLIQCSSYYGSKAIGPGQQPDYVNAVARLNTSLSAHHLLSQLQRIEHKQGRRRHTHWGPRTLDLDLLLYGTCVLQDSELTLPHPRLKERNFVVTPLFEIAPDLILPDGSTLVTLLENTTRENLWQLDHKHSREQCNGTTSEPTDAAGDDMA